MDPHDGNPTHESASHVSWLARRARPLCFSKRCSGLNISACTLVHSGWACLQVLDVHSRAAVASAFCTALDVRKRLLEDGAERWLAAAHSLMNSSTSVAKGTER